MSTWTWHFNKIFKSNRYIQYHSAFESNQSENNFIHDRTVEKEIDSMIQNEIRFEIVWNDHLWMKLLSILFESKAKWYWIYRLDLKLLLKCQGHVDMAKMARRNLGKRLYWDISLGNLGLGDLNCRPISNGKRLKPDTCHEPVHKRYKVQDNTNYTAPCRQYIKLKIKRKRFDHIYIILGLLDIGDDS